MNFKKWIKVIDKCELLKGYVCHFILQYSLMSQLVSTKFTFDLQASYSLLSKSEAKANASVLLSNLNLFRSS